MTCKLRVNLIKFTVDSEDEGEVDHVQGEEEVLSPDDVLAQIGDVVEQHEYVHETGGVPGNELGHECMY